MNPASITRLDLALAAPEIFLLAATCVILLVDLFLDDKNRWETFVLSLLARRRDPSALLAVGWFVAALAIYRLFMAPRRARNP